MEHSRRRGASIATLIAVSWIGAASAQVKYPVPAPPQKIGDVWRYRTIDLWNNRELSTSEVTLVKRAADRLTYQVKDSREPQATTMTWTADQQPCRSMGANAPEVCVGGVKFPLQLGGKQRYDKQPWSNGNGYNAGTCVVSGSEKVTVAAGAFDAVKIECEGFWNRVVDGTFSGRFTEVLWYAPAIRRYAKWRYVDYNSSGGIYNRTETELIAVRLRK